jgi:hypothetical protein
MFDIVYAALPRYFYTQFNTEVENLQITLDGSTERVSPTETKVSCDRAKLIYTYRNQCQVSYTMHTMEHGLTVLGCMLRKADSVLGWLRQDGVVTV